MVRYGLLFISMFLLAGCAEEGTPVAFDFDEACESAGQSPVCAAKTLQACRAYGGDQSLCAAIGVARPGRERNYRKDLTPPGDAPWRLTWSELARRQKFCGYDIVALEKVPQNRFRAEAPVPADRIGTHELVMTINNCEPGFDVMSLFMKEGPQGWVITSFDNWGVAYISDDTGPFYGSDCEWEENEDEFCAMRAVGITRYAPEYVASGKWRKPAVYTDAQIASSCQTQVGSWRANRYARWCREVSGATYPPCHPINSCRLMTQTIEAGCISLADSVGDYEFALPRYCLWALTKQTTLPSSRSTGD